MVVALLLGRFRDTGRMALILYADSRRYGYAPRMATQIHLFLRNAMFMNIARRLHE
jgi:hypothetical protein